MPVSSPILPLVRLEARLIWRRRASWLLLALFTVLMLLAGLLSGLRQTREREQQTAYQKLVRQQWEAQPDRHPHRAAHYGTFAFKPRSLLRKAISLVAKQTKAIGHIALKGVGMTSRRQQKK